MDSESINLGPNPSPVANMDIQINKGADYKVALDIAKKNSHFFNPQGLKTMEKDFEKGIL